MSDKAKKSEENAKDKWEELKVESLAAEEDETPALEHPSYEDLESRLTAAEQLAEQNWNKALRAQAELDNVKRRAERDISSAHKFGVEKLLLELIPVVDSLEHGLKAEEETEGGKATMRQGVELTLKMLYATLERFGVKVLNPAGEVFNPAYHEAMTALSTQEVEPNRVLQVLQKGFLLHERLIRPARVIVSKAG